MNSRCLFTAPKALALPAIAVTLALLLQHPVSAEPASGTYADDAAFLKKHTDAIELSLPDSEARLLVVPQWQGRVMTSAISAEGTSYGWLNYDLIKEGVQPAGQREGLTSHIYVFGGEERFWIGPEGGQFSSYFAPGSPFDFEHWFVPPFIDTIPWKLESKEPNRARFSHRTAVTNWSGSVWDMEVEREVALLAENETEKALGRPIPEGVKAVAHETVNRVINRGEAAWNKQTGMPSIWILGMLKHGAETTVAIPIQTEGKDLGAAVTSDYFGEVPPERLKVDQDKGMVYFKGDGQFRSKIGVSPQRSRGVAGSWDALNGVLTIVQYNQPDDSAAPYVNSLWKKQENPFSGDAINSYNDGPIGEDQLGPFYEIETSSPALNLAPGEGYTHVHRTIHLEGAKSLLEDVSMALLGAGLNDIEDALQGVQ